MGTRDPVGGVEVLEPHGSGDAQPVTGVDLDQAPPEGEPPVRAASRERELVEEVVDRGLAGAGQPRHVSTPGREAVTELDLVATVADDRADRGEALDRVAAQSMNVMLRTMSGNGWVERSRGSAGGRARPYRITPGGEGGLAPAREAVLAVEERMISGMGQEDRDTLLQLLAACLRSLE